VLLPCTAAAVADVLQKNYVDLANSDDKEQELRYETTQKRLAPWEGKVCVWGVQVAWSCCWL
jgi:hypothetical protein